MLTSLVLVATEMVPGDCSAGSRCITHCIALYEQTPDTKDTHLSCQGLIDDDVHRDKERGHKVTVGQGTMSLKCHTLLTLRRNMEPSPYDLKRATIQHCTLYTRALSDEVQDLEKTNVFHSLTGS